MTQKEFKKMLEEKGANKLLSLYMENKITFTQAQLNILCEKSKHHGGANFKYKKKKDML